MGVYILCLLKDIKKELISLKMLLSNFRTDVRKITNSVSSIADRLTT